MYLCHAVILCTEYIAGWSILVIIAAAGLSTVDCMVQEADGEAFMEKDQSESRRKITERVKSLELQGRLVHERGAQA